MVTSTLKIKLSPRFFDTTYPDLFWFCGFIFLIFIWRCWLWHKTRNDFQGGNTVAGIWSQGIWDVPVRFPSPPVSSAGLPLSIPAPWCWSSASPPRGKHHLRGCWCLQTAGIVDGDGAWDSSKKCLEAGVPLAGSIQCFRQQDGGQMLRTEGMLNARGAAGSMEIQGWGDKEII